MSQEKITRRKFIKTVSAATAGAAIALPAMSNRRIQGANDRVRVGIVGFSDRARYTLIPAFQNYADEFNFEIVAVSDIWKRRREEGLSFLQKLTGKKIAGMQNNEELYDSGTVDAVIISTADFQHAPLSNRFKPAARSSRSALSAGVPRTTSRLTISSVRDGLATSSRWR
jgi:hypothetical protein